METPVMSIGEAAEKAVEIHKKGRFEL